MSKTARDTDEQLIATYRNTGRRDVLDQLVQSNVSMVRSTVYQMVLDEALADDLTQEVFVRALIGLSSFNGRSRFSTWLYRVAMNTTHSYLRRQSRSPVEYRTEIPETADNDHLPEQAAMQEELEDEVAAALAELSPKLRAAIVLTSLQQIEIKEAAKIENCSRATMYWRIHEARRQLKNRLEKHFQYE